MRLGEALVRNRKLHEVMVCLGLGGLVLAILLPSEPPLLTAHFILVCVLTLVGVVGGVLAFIQLLHRQ